MANQRDPNKKLVGFFASKEEHDALKSLAKKHKCSVAELLRRISNGTIKLGLWLLFGCLAAAKLTHNPMDWSGEACASAVGQGFRWFGSGVAWAWNAGSSILASL